MKCLTFEQMMSYLDGEVDMQQRVQIDRHLAVCPVCRQALENCSSDLAAYDALAEAYLIPDTFTDEIMAAISANVTESRPPVKISAWDHILNTCWRGSMKKKIVVTAASLAIAFSIGTYTSPSFASYVQTLLKIQAETKDQDITFKVKEASINPLGIALDYEFLKNGKPFENNNVLFETFSFNIEPGSQLDDFYGYDLNSSKKNDVYVTDKQGNKIIDRTKISTTGKVTGDITKSVLVINLFDNAFERLPDEIFVHFEINNIDGKEGKWHLTTPINVKELKQKSQLVMTDKQYTLPDGSVFDLIGWQSINAVSQFFLETTPSPGWQSTGFQVTNKRGEVVAAFDPAGLHNVNYVDSGGEGEIMGIIHGLQFKRFDDRKDLTFELTTFVKKDQTDIHMTIDPLALSHKPIVKDLGGGKTLKVTKVELNADGSSKKVPIPVIKSMTGETIIDQDFDNNTKGVFIYTEGLLDKETYNFREWKVKVDGQEVEYTFDPTRIEQDANGNYKFRKVIVIPNVTEMPKQITLESADMYKKTPVDWKVPLGSPEQ